MNHDVPPGFARRTKALPSFLIACIVLLGPLGLVHAVERLVTNGRDDGNLVPEDTNSATDIFARDISRDFDE